LVLSNIVGQEAENQRVKSNDLPFFSLSILANIFHYQFRKSTISNFTIFSSLHQQEFERVCKKSFGKGLSLLHILIDMRWIGKSTASKLGCGSFWIAKSKRTLSSKSK